MVRTSGFQQGTTQGRVELCAVPIRRVTAGQGRSLQLLLAFSCSESSRFMGPIVASEKLEITVLHAGNIRLGAGDDEGVVNIVQFVRPWRDRQMEVVKPLLGPGAAAPPHAQLDPPELTRTSPRLP